MENSEPVSSSSTDLENILRGLDTLSNHMEEMACKFFLFLFFFLVCLHSPTSHPHALRRYHSSYLQADTPLLDSNCDKASSGRWTLQLFLFFVRRHLSGGVMLRDVCQLVLWLMCKKTIQCKGGVNNILPMRGRCYLLCLFLPRGTVVD